MSPATDHRCVRMTRAATHTCLCRMPTAAACLYRLLTILLLVYAQPACLPLIYVCRLSTSISCLCRLGTANAYVRCLLTNNYCLRLTVTFAAYHAIESCLPTTDACVCRLTPAYHCRLLMPFVIAKIYMFIADACLCTCLYHLRLVMSPA